MSAITLLSSLYFAGACGGIFFALISALKSTVASRMLALFLGVLSFDLFIAWFLAVYGCAALPFLAGLRLSIPFLYGPLLYISAALITGKAPLCRAQFLHAVPFVLHTLFMLPFYLKSSASAAFLCSFDGGHTGQIEPFAHLFLAAKALHLGIYLAAVLKLIDFYERLTAEFFAEPENHRIGWLRLVVVIIYAMVFALFADLVDRFGLPGFVRVSVPPLFYLLALVLIYLIGFFIYARGSLTEQGIDFDELLKASSGPAPLQQEQEADEAKYAKTKLEISLLQDYLLRLERYMDREKPFKDSLITLPVLAKKLGIPPHHLSQTINVCLKQNFYAYINSRRIEHAKVLIKEKGSEENILSIAYEAGFNSKSAFNTYFKKLTGKTPSEYRKDLV